LLSRLAQSEDPSATALLQGLLHCPELAAQRDWLLHLIDQWIVTDADYLPWETSAIREFARDYETDPRTDGELFRIILHRLGDIKDDVERSDNSLREEVRRGEATPSLSESSNVYCRLPCRDVRGESAVFEKAWQRRSAGSVRLGDGGRGCAPGNPGILDGLGVTPAGKIKDEG
jgi:hypothetical protein